MDDTMDLDDLDYLYNLSIELENATDPSAVHGRTITLCTKNAVNAFGATFIPVFYLTIFTLGYVGNGLVLAILFKYEKLHTVTNVFLLNLVLSNLIFAASLPFWATYHMSEWLFGRFLCKAVSGAYLVGYNSSILFLTLMTFDRYLAVVHAVAAAKSRKKRYAIAASVVVWLISAAASVKDIILRDVSASTLNGLLCEETGYSKDIMNRWHFVSFFVQFSLFFLFPLLMVMFCYTSITVRILATRMKKKCRTIKLIFVIIFTFFVFWTPYNVVCLLQALQLSSASQDASSCADSETLDYAFYVTRNLAYFYCGISPVFYTFVGKKFQSHFRKLIGERVPCLKRRLSLSSQSSRTSSQKTPHSTYQASAFSVV